MVHMRTYVASVSVFYPTGRIPPCACVRARRVCTCTVTERRAVARPPLLGRRRRSGRGGVLPVVDGDAHVLRQALPHVAAHVEVAGVEHGAAVLAERPELDDVLDPVLPRVERGEARDSYPLLGRRDFGVVR